MTQVRLTDFDYWEAGYRDIGGSPPLNVDDYRQLGARRVVEKLESLGLTGRSVLEVGAGNSAVLTCLASRFGTGAAFSGLDYSERGCQMLARRAEREQVSLSVFNQDLFAPSSEVVGRFDVVYSLGVVEHFTSLSGVLEALTRLLAPHGRMLTVIPNMAGVLGGLTRRYNRGVYDLHVCHDLHSFLAGHREARLVVEDAGYLCSTNFGVLSSCFASEADPGWSTYRWLSRLTKALWSIEARIGDLPHSARFSPYIYAVSHTER